jgi:hypothetical protein
MSKYACTPSNAVPYKPPTGFVVDVTPLTLISVGVTPVSLTGGKPPPAAVLPVPPDVVVVSFVFPELELLHAAATATNVKTTSQRARIQPSPRIGCRH